MAVGGVRSLSYPLPYRPHDYAYDPIFLVSSSKDHYKAAKMAKLSTANYQICPIFANMFSDLPHHQSRIFVRRRSARVSKGATSTTDADQFPVKEVNVSGSDRYRYFSVPKVKIPNLVPELQLHQSTPAEQSPLPKPEPKNQNKKVQTVYREGSMQTSPWEPAYVLVQEDEGEAKGDSKGDSRSTKSDSKDEKKCDPELLKLDFLKWGSGLPAGMHEVELIERARMKRAWEERCTVRTSEDFERRRNVIAALERNEWAFREKEIQEIQDLRLKLLENMLNELHEKANRRNETKLRNFAELKYAEKDKKLKKLRDKTTRELRKLDLKYAGTDNKYHYVNVADEHVNHASEIYAPMMRNGEHPKRWHLVIDEASKRFRAQYTDVRDFDTLPTWLDTGHAIKDCICLKMKGTRLCMRETKWTAPVLKNLHAELLALRKHTITPCTLIRRIESPPSAISTPEVEGISDSDEDFYQAMVLMQSIIKGRAAQMHIYEGRERCRELIQELKYSSGLLEEENIQTHEYKLKIKLQQRVQQIEEEKLYRIQEGLDELQSTIIGSLLDFLNKELRRLMEERRAHAICILLERERFDREAAEAGRRQVEVRRRREHDEMFKQTVKIQQESVDLYLEDIIKEGMDFTSDEEAREYVRNIARKIDEEAMQLKEAVNLGIFDEEETIANLVQHFVVPEVEKKIIRQKIQKKQKEKLKVVHDAIYTEIEGVTPDMIKEALKTLKPQPTESKEPSISSEKDVDAGNQTDLSFTDSAKKSVSIEEPDVSKEGSTRKSSSLRVDPVTGAVSKRSLSLDHQRVSFEDSLDLASVPPEQHDDAPDQASTAPERTSVASEQASVTPEQHDDAPDRASTSLQRTSIASQQASEVPERASIASAQQDTASVAIEQHTAPPVQQDATSEGASVANEQHDVATTEPPPGDSSSPPPPTEGTEQTQ